MPQFDSITGAMIQQLIVVEWNADEPEWIVHARRSDTEDYTAFYGEEGELDALLSIARDVVTGG